MNFADRKSYEGVDYYENFDLKNIITPIKVDVFEKLLKESGYDPGKTRFLVEGFRSGFLLEYAGPTDRQDEAKNIPLRVGSQTDLWNKIMKEVKLKRYAGPFKRPPYTSYI